MRTTLIGSVAIKMRQEAKAGDLTPEELACAMYEGLPIVQNLAEELARKHGKAEALCPFDNQYSEVKKFWIDIATRIINHSKEWLPNESSCCVLSNSELEKINENLGN